jgi:hypothetical protein
MDIKSLINKTKEKKEYFWALLLEAQWISSAVWQIEGGKVEVISTSPSTRWENEENLIEAVDASLSSCTQNLPEDIGEPSKTVFGVPSLWVEGGNIKEEHLASLKKICQELSLEPSGFVVLPEAIAHFVKIKEESPLSGVTVGISNENLDISVFNLGKLIGTTIVARSVSVQEDLLEGLSRLAVNQESFPPRILLYNQKEPELEEIKSALESFEWGKIGESGFLHTPKLEIIEPDNKILAVCLAGGSEMEEVTGIKTNLQIENLENNEVVDKIEESTFNKPEELENVSEPRGITPEDLGFVVGGGSGEIKKKFNLKLPKLPVFKFKKPTINFATNKRPFIVGGITLVTIFVIGFILWWFLPKASVTVFVSPKKLEERISLEFGTDISVKDIAVSVSSDKTKSTTGTKTVGEKAKGSVKVQNGTAFAINLPSGTIITSATDLRFVTTKTASISGALSPSEPGTAVIDVEAGNIGSEYNLAKDEIFKVANYPKAEVDATSTNNFTGGTSRQISAVSENDRSTLLKDLTNELLDEAKTKLKEKISEEDLLIEPSLKVEVKNEDFSNKVGDEASTIKLSLELNAVGSTVSKKDLTSISKRQLEGKIPLGFVLHEDQILYDFSSTSDETRFEVIISVNLLPNINPDEIAKKIVGKYPNLAESYLGNVPGFVRAEFRIKPLLPGKLGTLPHLYKNISVEISAER